MRAILVVLTFAPVLSACARPPEAPPTGEPSSPAAAAPGEPGGATPTPSQPAPVLTQDGPVEALQAVPGLGDLPGVKVEVSGTLRFEGSHEGLLRLDLMRPLGEGKCQLVEARVAEFGSWSVEVPAGYGELLVSSFLDVAEDGTPDGDPMGFWPRTIEVGSEPVSGIDIVLLAKPDHAVPHPCPSPTIVGSAAAPSPAPEPSGSAPQG